VGNKIIKRKDRNFEEKSSAIRNECNYVLNWGGGYAKARKRER
jgi:hypothetical protein